MVETQVLEDDALVIELQKRRNSVRHGFKHLGRILIFLTFVLLFVIVAVSEHPNQNQDFVNTMQETFDTRAVVPISNVKSIPDLWNYINRTLVNPVFQAREAMAEDPVAALGINQTELDLFGTQLIGQSLAIRTFRVKKNVGCKVDETFKEYACYPAYSPETKSEDDFGEGRSVFQFGEPRTTTFPDVSGRVADYSGAGFYVTFPNEDDPLDLVIMKRLVDEQTRAALIEFNVWSPNRGLMGVVSLMFERSVTGEWVNTFSVDVLEMRYVEITLGWLMLAEMILILFVCFYVGEELSELYIKGLKYWRDGWNLVDWTNLVLLMYWSAIRVRCYLDAQGVMEQLNGSTYTDLSRYVNYVDSSRKIHAINAVFLALKVAKYVTFIPFVTTLNNVLRISWQYFVSYAFIFASVFFGFSLAYNIGFGNQFPHLSNFWRAGSFLARIFVGSANLDELVDTAPRLSGALLLVLILVMYLLWLNVFTCVMMISLGEAKMRLVPRKVSWQTKVTKFLHDTAHVVLHQWHVAEKFESYFPKLVAYWHTESDRKRILEDERRQDRLFESAVSLRIANDGGPASLHCGRKAKKTNENDMVVRFIEDSSDSEADLGPLSTIEILLRKRQELQGKPSPLSESELYFNAIHHMATDFEERGKAMNNTITFEMQEIKRLCAGVHVVLTVLSRRTTDLASEQKKFMTQYAAAAR